MQNLGKSILCTKCNHTYVRIYIFPNTSKYVSSYLGPGIRSSYVYAGYASDDKVRGLQWQLSCNQETYTYVLWSVIMWPNVLYL